MAGGTLSRSTLEYTAEMTTGTVGIYMCTVQRKAGAKMIKRTGTLAHFRRCSGSSRTSGNLQVTAAWLPRFVPGPL